MYKHILIATDGSSLATQAVEHGLALAKQHDARVTIVTVTELWSAGDVAHEVRMGQPDPIGRFEELAETAAKKILDGAAQRGAAHGLKCDVVHVKDQHPAEGIIEAAITMRSHCYGFPWSPRRFAACAWQQGLRGSFSLQGTSAPGG